MTTTQTLSPQRLGRLTASRVPKILGLSPWGGPEDCMREMVRDAWGAAEEFTGNIATEWGNEHEADAIEEYERETGLLVTGQQQFTIHPDHDWLAMSPDGQVMTVGADTDGPGIVEAKCPYRARYNHWKERPDIAAQMSMQTEVAQVDWNDLIVWRQYGYSISRKPHDETWLTFNLPPLRDFHDRYLEVVASPELSAPYLTPLVDERTDIDWSFAAMEYLETLADLEETQRQCEDAKARLRELADGRTTRGAGVLVYGGGPTKGRVNTKKLYADFNISPADLDRYRGTEGRREQSVKALARGGSSDDD